MPKWYGESALNPDKIIPPKDQWKDQWKRVGRWYSRVLRLEEKSRTQVLDLSDLDDLVAFFQNSYHLREWIEKTHPELKDKLVDLFKDNFELGACRDICNGYKHKNISRPSHDPDFNFYREYDYFEVMGGEGRNPEKYRVVFLKDNQISKHDVFDLAGKCYGIWRNFVDPIG